MIPPNAKQFVRRYGGYVFGRSPRLHRIPFGPLRGMYIYTSFGISPRMYLGVDEPWTARVALSYLQPGDTVYDVGAHVGYTSLLFRRCVGPHGTLHAFEIMPSVADGFFSETIRANGITNVVIHPVGLAEAERTVRLKAGDTMMGSLRNAIDPRDLNAEMCTVVPLDGYAAAHRLPPPQFIKVDIECAEVDFLRGALGMIRRCKPLMIIEFHSLELLRDGIPLLEPLGYSFRTERRSINLGYSRTISRFHQSVLCTPASYATRG